MKLKIALLVLLSSLSAFALESGVKAPDFTLGKIKLSDYKGKVVVLEWLNHGCPFVRKHYDSGNMQALQSKYVAKNVIWLSIISSAPGKQGFVTEEEARKDMVTNKSGATQVLLDPTGEVGQLYGAKTTPHMFIVDKEGNLAYQGAIDDKDDANKDSVPLAKNYVAEALDLILENKKVSQATTKSYGCGVKYQ
jgi:thioredoxin-related protein